MGKEPIVAAIPAIIRIKKREKKINRIFLPINFLYCAFISSLFVCVPDIASVLDVMTVNFLSVIDIQIFFSCSLLITFYDKSINQEVYKLFNMNIKEHFRIYYVRSFKQSHRGCRYPDKQ